MSNIDKNELNFVELNASESSVFEINSQIKAT